jgi:hypothetical protein
MIFLRHLGYFPGQFKERNKLINTVHISNIKKQEAEDGSLTIVATTNFKYETIIQLINPSAKLLSPVKISCNCQSFNYDFAMACLRNESLYGNITQKNSLSKHLPKKRNPFIIATGCKHIHALSRIIIKNKLFK